MKRLSLLLPVILLAGSYCAGQASSSGPATTQTVDGNSPSLSISIAAPTSPVHLGSPLNITATMKNIGAKRIYWDIFRGKDSPYMVFRIKLMKDGHEVETTFFHRKLLGQQRPGDPLEVESGSAFASHLDPGESYATTIDLTRLYEITKPGVYTLDVSFDNDYNDNKTWVHGKPVTLKIEP